MWFDTAFSVQGYVLITKGPGQASIGQTYNLGSFAAGAQLDFGIHDLTTEHIFKNTGLNYLNNGMPASDNQAHSKVWFNGITAYIGFEDRSNAQNSDWNYNDVVFKVNNVTAVPDRRPGVCWQWDCLGLDWHAVSGAFKIQALQQKTPVSTGILFVYRGRIGVCDLAK